MSAKFGYINESAVDKIYLGDKLIDPFNYGEVVPTSSPLQMTVTSISEPQITPVGGAVNTIDNGDGTWAIESSDQITSFTFVANDDVTNIVCHKADSLTSMANMFSYMSYAVAIIFEDEWDTSNVTSMENLFGSCNALQSVDLSNFDTSSLENMSSMLGFCSSLTTVDLSTFDLTALDNMESVFRYSGALENVILPVAAPTAGMKLMFQNCNSLVCVNAINTLNATNRENIFLDCTALIQPDAAALVAIEAGANWVNPNPCPPPIPYTFDMTVTSPAMPEFTVAGGDVTITDNGDGSWAVRTEDLVTSVGFKYGSAPLGVVTSVVCHKANSLTSMWAMFSGLIIATSITFEADFDTSQVTEMGNAFKDCKAITSLDLSPFDTSNATSLGSMFANCEELTSIDVSHFTAPNLTSLRDMFMGCKKLAGTVDLSGLANTTQLSHVQQIFYNCNAVTSINLSNLIMPLATNMSLMFSGCKALISLDISSFETGNVTTMNNMFRDCHVLPAVDVSSFDTGNVTDMQYMFALCHKLTSLDTVDWDLSSLANAIGTFRHCHELICLTGLDIPVTADTNVTFDDCPLLVAPNASEQADIIAGTPWTNPNACP